MAASDAQQPTQRYLVSARKYRPQTFDDVVAQEHVTATLRNALLYDRLAHAYLFSGPRGVGKTTAARLLAKAINCQTPLEERDAAEPCRTCTSCRAFEEGRDMNVIEIDAASNRKIDDVRDLREGIRIPPQGARKKVYILDEIHMLTKEAFNALLKTLEEPPSHALFIFATTEPHKVLPTILSRCQRFDFKRIPVDLTISHLQEICEQEDIVADEASLLLIARRGDGALRDALSLFDQAVALCGRTLTYDALAEALGVVDRDLYFSVMAAARERDTAALLATVDDIVGRGYDLAEFLGGLVEHLRNVYVAVATGSADLVEADTPTRQRYLEAAQPAREADLLRAMLVIDEAERHLRNSPQPRLTVELALLRLAHLEPVRSLAGLIDELKRFEGEAPPSPSRSDEPSPRSPAPAATSEPKPSPYRHATQPPEASARRPEPPAGSDDGGLPAPPPPPRTPAPTGTGAATSGRQSTDIFGSPALKRRERPNPAAGDGGPEPTALAVTATDDFGEALGRVRDVWPQVIEAAREASASMASVLGRSAPTHTRGGAVAITVPDTFSRDVLHRERKLFSRALRTALGGEPPPFALEVKPDDPETAASEDPFETLKRLRNEHPTLRLLFERFGAEIVWS